jgi:thymidine phosphorylase
VVWRVQPGDEVSAGDVLLELHTDDPTRLDRARESLGGAVVIADSAPGAATPIVLDRVG